MRAASGLIAISPQDGIVSPDYAVFRTLLGVIPEYFTALFKIPLLQSLFRSFSKGLGTGSSGFLRLYSEDFLSLWFPVPPVEEQQEIINFLRQEYAQNSQMEADLNLSISLLKERRSALITAAVTGQLAQERMAI
jgi:type I restriction enzyme S subunit